MRDLCQDQAPGEHTNARGHQVAVEESAAWNLSPAQSPLPPNDKRLRARLSGEPSSSGCFVHTCSAQRIVHSRAVAFRGVRSYQELLMFPTLWSQEQSVSLSHDVRTQNINSLC